VVIGFLTIQPMLYGDLLKDAIHVNLELHPAMEELAAEFHGATAMGLHAFGTLPFLLALAGVVVAYVFYLVKPGIPQALAKTFAPLIRVMDNKYYLDWINENILAAGARQVGRLLWKVGDEKLIDGAVVNGSASAVGGIAKVIRTVQTGYLSFYALVMVLGVFGLMTWQLWPYLMSRLGH
jgi:NADH-quinone oxidoreductase subunit L